MNCPKCRSDTQTLVQDVVDRREFRVTARKVTTIICLRCGYAEVSVSPYPDFGHENKVGLPLPKHQPIRTKPWKDHEEKVGGEKR